MSEQSAEAKSPQTISPREHLIGEIERTKLWFDVAKNFLTTVGLGAAVSVGFSRSGIDFKNVQWSIGTVIFLVGLGSITLFGGILLGSVFYQVEKLMDMALVPISRRAKGPLKALLWIFTFAVFLSIVLTFQSIAVGRTGSS